MSGFFREFKQLEPILYGKEQLEIKTRTWSRRDAENKAQLASELLSVLGASSGEKVTEDYIDLVSEA